MTKGKIQNKQRLTTMISGLIAEATSLIFLTFDLSKPLKAGYFVAGNSLVFPMSSPTTNIPQLVSQRCSLTINFPSDEVCNETAHQTGTKMSSLKNLELFYKIGTLFNV